MISTTITTLQAEENLIDRIGIAGADVVLNATSLSELVGKKVEVGRLRFKPGTSIVAAWSAGRRPEDRGWVGLFKDPVKVDNALRRAGRVGARASAPPSLPGLVIGDLWSDVPLSRDLKRIRKKASDISVLRHNPRRRLVASAEIDDAHYCVRVADGPHHLASSSMAWSEWGAPVLPVLPMKGTLFATLSPWWGSGDLTQRPEAWAAAEAGRQIAHLHHVSVRPDLALRPFDLTKITAPLTDLAPWWTDRLTDVLARLDERKAQLWDASVVAVHGDFSADQILLGQGEIRIIDLDRATEGTAAQDVGHFVGSAMRNGQEQLLGAFLGGYQEVASIDDHAVRTWTSISLLSAANEPFRSRHPHWVDEMDTIITLAEKAITS